MKNLYFISALFLFTGLCDAQCTLTISQNPPPPVCNVNPTLTAIVAGGGGLVIDQNQSVNTTCMATFGQQDLAQSFIPTATTVCGAGINLTNNAAGPGIATISLWSNLPTLGGVMLATGTVVSNPNTWADVMWPSAVTVTIGTTYYLVFQGSNTAQCIGGSTSNPYPGGNVYANLGFSSFPGFDYTFRTYSGCSPSATYLWSTGSTSAAITATTNGAYSVTITAGACTNTAVQSITINPSPTISVNSGTICSGKSFTIIASGANTYTYTPGGPVVSPTTTASFSVSGTDLLGCVSASPAISNIFVNPLPFVSVASTSSLLCTGQTATLTATGATSYSWNTGAATAVIVINPTITTTYSVSGTDTNGCKKVTVFTQSVSTCAGINQLGNNNFVIKVFPNPVNSKLFIDAGGIEMKNTKLSVINPLGQILFESDFKTEIDLHFLAGGIYYLKIWDGIYQRDFKIIKD